MLDYQLLQQFKEEEVVLDRRDKAAGRTNKSEENFGISSGSNSACLLIEYARTKRKRRHKQMHKYFTRVTTISLVRFFNRAYPFRRP